MGQRLSFLLDSSQITPNDGLPIEIDKRQVEGEFEAWFRLGTNQDAVWRRLMLERMSRARGPPPVRESKN